MGKRIYPAGIAKNHMPIYKYLLRNEGSFLMASIAHSGNTCYRLMDVARNPVRIHSKALVDKMLENGFLEKQDGKVIISENGRSATKNIEEKTEHKVSYAFGKTNMYNKGDIVYYKGEPEMICKIECRAISAVGDDYFFINTTYPKLHYTMLRNAKPSEIKKLGKKKVLLIKKEELNEAV